MPSLKEDEPTGKLNPNQQKIVAHLRAAEGRLAVEELRQLSVPKTTLATLVRRGFVEILEEPAGLALPAMKPRNTIDFLFTPEQQKALERMNRSVEARQFQAILLHGVTGSGKTAVYLAAMRQVLKSGRGSILLVPEIGLTPRVAADLHGIFGEEVAILHSVALRRRTRRAVAPLQPRRSAHRGGNALGGVCSGP